MTRPPHRTGGHVLYSTLYVLVLYCMLQQRGVYTLLYILYSIYTIYSPIHIPLPGSGRLAVSLSFACGRQSGWRYCSQTLCLYTQKYDTVEQRLYTWHPLILYHQSIASFASTCSSKSLGRVCTSTIHTLYCTYFQQLCTFHTSPTDGRSIRPLWKEH